jgi:hypothetical protein
LTKGEKQKKGGSMNNKVEFECLCGCTKYFAEFEKEDFIGKYSKYRERPRPRMYYCADCSILFKNPTDFTNFARRKLR